MGRPSRLYRDWISHPKGTDSYWDEGFWGLLKKIPSNVKVPMFINEGWFDHHLGSALTGYASLDPDIRKHSWLRIGCWNHYFNNPLEGLEPANLNATEVPAALEWFDLTLKQHRIPERKVEYYEVGDDSWHTVTQWPLSADDVEESRLFFALSGDESDQNAHALVDRPKAKTEALQYNYDPANPVATRGGEALLTTMQEIGARIQPKPGYRADVLSFLTAPFEQDVHIQGAIRVELYISSTAPDTAFTAKLMCVDPDGTARNYRGSITTIALDTPDAEPYTPGDIRKVSVEMWDICWKVPAGSRNSLRYRIIGFFHNIQYIPIVPDYGVTDRCRQGRPDHIYGFRNAFGNCAAGSCLIDDHKEDGAIMLKGECMPNWE